MASTYHFSSLPVPAGKSAAAHYDYLAREGKYSVEYYGQDDLRVEQSGNMPAWAAKPGRLLERSRPLRQSERTELPGDQRRIAE